MINLTAWVGAPCHVEGVAGIRSVEPSVYDGQSWDYCNLMEIQYLL